MIRDILRIIGTACILAGGILYFTNSAEHAADSDIQRMQKELDTLQIELAKTKEELAVAQTISSVEESPPAENDVKSPPTGTDSIVETVLTIAYGAKSTTVSNDLEQAGIIQDATAFNDFLIDNKLEGSIQIGDHNVDSSMDFQAIATVITTVK